MLYRTRCDTWDVSRMKEKLYREYNERKNRKEEY